MTTSVSSRTYAWVEGPGGSTPGVGRLLRGMSLGMVYSAVAGGEPTSASNCAQASSAASRGVQPWPAAATPARAVARA